MVRLLLHGGDTMLGRAVQLTFPYQAPDEAQLTDSTRAGNYLYMALHRKHGGRLVPLTFEELEMLREMNRDGSYLWGDYLDRLIITPEPDVRLLNLETAVTETITNKDVPRKGINYHMHSGNLPLVFDRFSRTKFQEGEDSSGNASAIPYVVSFSNNHAMDFGRTAFEDESLRAFARLPGYGDVVGAGMNISDAQRSVRVRLSRPSRKKAGVSVVAVTTECSGTPYWWSATKKRSGVVCLPALNSEQATDHAMQMLSALLHANGYEQSRRPYDDLLVLSIHWGPNWAYRSTVRGGNLDFQRCRQKLAHRIIRELGVDVIYGHSSHHIRGMEVYDGKLIVYGAGDLINDYEGFENEGNEAYSPFGALFVVDASDDDGTLQSVRLIPTMVDRLQLKRVSSETVRRWRPKHECVEVEESAVSSLCEAVNKYSTWDVGDHGRRVELRVVKKDEQVPGGPTLVYP